MKKVKLDKLSLKKWAVARLQLDALKHLKGGYNDTNGGTVYGNTCGGGSGPEKTCGCNTRTAGITCPGGKCV
jgi:hypothetical protein